ncbi:protein of unknown function [Methylocaldum szegediense]|uniref:Uncharacterized protein n=1 Tax=Methylocaldum szegediense TaxID=73780 RepID=A0ABM9I2K0_9GAMM|nr:protein of unknown function [Methylocaldum szegediense]
MHCYPRQNMSFRSDRWRLEGALRCSRSDRLRLEGRFRRSPETPLAIGRDKNWGLALGRRTYLVIEFPRKNTL